MSVIKFSKLNIVYRLICLLLCAVMFLSCISFEAFADYRLREQEFVCGYAEHIHNDNCCNPYFKIMNKWLYPELINSRLSDDELREMILAEEPDAYGRYCGLPEHIHEDRCRYSPLLWDLKGEELLREFERPEEWEECLPDILTGDWSKDIISVARSQLGYTESYTNYIVENDTAYGYTRYGEWFGMPYGEWCAMFLSFCAYYADIPRAAFPYASSVQTWVNDFESKGVFIQGTDYRPRPGDLVFFKYRRQEVVTHVGIITDYYDGDGSNPAYFTTIEGNNCKQVRESFRYVDDSDIYGYASMRGLMGLYGLEDEALGVTCGNTRIEIVLEDPMAVNDISTLYAVQCRSGSDFYTDAYTVLSDEEPDIAANYLLSVYELRFKMLDDAEAPFVEDAYIISASYDCDSPQNVRMVYSGDTVLLCILSEIA